MRPVLSKKTVSAASSQEFDNKVASLAGEICSPAVVALSGPLGAGKTQFVRALVNAIGGTSVSSPSFAIIQRYQGPKFYMDHVDLYRLKDDADLESTGFWELFSVKDAVVFVEWADRLPESVWPLGWELWVVRIEITSPTAREIHITRK